MTPSPRFNWLVMSLSALAVAGCDLSMKDQPRRDTLEGDRLWPEGPPAEGLPTGVVIYGDARDADRPQMSAALLRRGQARYRIYCTPCHGESGRGDGLAVQRGLPAPPDYRQARLRAAPAQHFYDVISDGYGVMYGYGDRIAPEDRWAIVAYVRALQDTRRERPQ